MNTQFLPKQLSNVRLRDLLTQKISPERNKILQSADRVSFLPMETIGEKGKVDLSNIRSKEDVEKGYTLLFENDVLVAKITPCFENGKGAVAKGLINGVGFGTTELYVLSPKPEVNSRFLYYITASHTFRKLGEANMTGAAGQKRVPTEYVNNFRVDLPTFQDQQKIANYLDRETEKIDTLIAAKKRLLKLLAEKRRSMITHAVTCGLRDDVPMKDSGVEWIGKIPEDWRLVKIKHVATIGNGSTPLRDELPYWQNGLFPWLTSTVANDDIIGDAEEFVTALALKECHLPIIRPNSILVAITGQGKTRGKAALLPYQATINQHLAFITPLDKFLEAEFLRLFMTSAYNVLRMISEGMGSTKGALTCEQLGDFIIPLPSIAEQQEIVNNLQNITQHLDLLSGITTEAIALLQERRTSLISAAVTGQIHIAD